MRNHTAHSDGTTPQPHHAELNEWLAPIRAAAHLSSSASTLAKLRLKGGGPRFCKIGRAVRYRRSDLDAWLNSTGRRSTSDVGAD